MPTRIIVFLVDDDDDDGTKKELLLLGQRLRNDVDDVNDKVRVKLLVVVVKLDDDLEAIIFSGFVIKVIVVIIRSTNQTQSIE
jgi:hypothetical protein